jgi:hypothetical protein
MREDIKVSLITVVIFTGLFIFLTFVVRPSNATEPDTDTITLYDLELPPTLTISCEDGNEVIIDWSGKEVVVTGASEEGARLFFEVLLKQSMDEYIESKLDELCPTLEELFFTPNMAGEITLPANWPDGDYTVDEK